MTPYIFDKPTDTLTILGGALGSGTNANTIAIQNFNLSAAENGGFLGISLAKIGTLNFGATAGVDPPAPNFNAGATQSYTFSTDTADSTAQTLTLTLAGVNPADFTAMVGNQSVQQNSDGTFSFLLPAGETNVAFSLTNSADVGGAANLQLSAIISDPNNPNGAAVTSNTLTQTFLEPADDPFKTPQPIIYNSSSLITGGPITYTYSVVSGR